MSRSSKRDEKKVGGRKRDSSLCKEVCTLEHSSQKRE